MNDKNKDLFTTLWHKSPNVIIDRISGTHLSPSAVMVVMTVIRYTEGMGGKQSAEVPMTTFMRVVGTNRDKTAYKFVKEAIASGLINADKKKGCVTKYSINTTCELWHKTQVVAESATSGEKCHTSSGEKCHEVVAESASKPVAESATLIKTKEISKDLFKEQEEAEQFNKAYEVITKQLRMAGIIPIDKPVIDDQLKPEIYSFVDWFNGTDMAETQRARQAVKWFMKMGIEDRKRFYTLSNTDCRRVFEATNDEPAPMSDERAEEIKAMYADTLIGLGF